MLYFRLICKQHLLYTGLVITVRLGHTVRFCLTPPEIIVDCWPTRAAPYVFGLHGLPSREVKREDFNAGRYAVSADAVLRVCEQGRTLHAELLGMVDELSARMTKRVRLLKTMRRLIGAEPREVRFAELDILTDKVRIRLDDELRVDLHFDEIDAETALDLLRRAGRAQKKAAA
jgi:hypothetical protein